MVPVPAPAQWSQRTAASSGLRVEGLRALCPDGAGGIWTGGDAGYLIHIRAGGQAQQWPLGSPIQALAWAGGYVWAGTPAGLIRFDSVQVLSLSPLGSSPAAQDIGALATGPDGRLWVGSREGGIAYRSSSGWRLVEIPFSSGATAGRAIRSLRVDAAGDLWAGTAGQGVWQREAGVWGRLPLAAPVTALAGGSLRHWWAGTAGGGLYWVGSTGLLPLSGPEGLRSDSIADLQVDARGFVWVATAQGVQVISDPSTGPDIRVDLWGENRGLANQDIRALLLQPDGAVWVATRRGLWHYQP